MVDSVQLQSSMLGSASYSDAEQTLDLVLVDGTVYKYWLVPRGVFEGLAVAPSPGQYFWSAIRNRYPYRRIR